MSAGSARRRRRRHVPYTADFLTFWARYPRKVKKPLAAVAWLDERPNLAEVLAALEWQVRDPDWIRDGGQYIPHPSAYINQRRWEDEKSTLSIVSGKEARGQVAAQNVLERARLLGMGGGK